MKRTASLLSELRLGTAKNAFAVLVLLTASPIALPAQTFTTLFSFDGGTNGVVPYGGLVQGTDGNLYGTTFSGYGGDSGTVFKITPSGALTTIYTFCATFPCQTGFEPVAPLVVGTDENFYGTTYGGGANNAGTAFRLTVSGTLTTLYSFCDGCGAVGAFPFAGLVQATNGDLYGTTTLGGPSNSGTVFKITPGGTLTTLYSFCSQTGCTDGARPTAGLIQATNGDLYGTTEAGGANDDCSPYPGCGTVFEITPTGGLTTLYSFCGQSGCTDGSQPIAGLVQATNGNLYGTTSTGGDTLNYFIGLGTVFKITPGGKLTTLYRFCEQFIPCTDGFYPYAGLVQATDGNLYGTTEYGGNNNCAVGDPGCGTIFRITTSGELTTLYSFCGQVPCTDGAYPYAGLVQATNGTFYGTTYSGGDVADTNCVGGCGAVFSLSVGLGPFVETVPTSGEVGATVKILGNSLKGATSVTFKGTAATFKVVSSSEIITTVPTGATTGTVKVVTPSGTLSSNVAFLVP